MSGVPTALLPEGARRLVVDAAIEVLRAKEPPEMPTWLRKLRDFEPRRLRAGRAAAEILRGVDQVAELRAAVSSLLAGREAELKLRLESSPVAAVDSWLSGGGDPARLGALAVALEADVAGYVAGRAAAAAESVQATALVDEARRAAESARREAATRVEGARSEAREAQAGRSEATQRLKRAQAELRRLRAAAEERDSFEASSGAAREAQARVEGALAEAEGQRDVAYAERDRVKGRVAGLESENAALKEQVASLTGSAGEGDAETGRPPEPALEQVRGAATEVAGALEEAVARLRAAVVGSPAGKATQAAPAREPRSRTGESGERRRRAAARRRPPLPQGMNPDTPEGLVALLGDGVLLMVDGYNALLDREGMVERQSLLNALNGLVRGSGAHAWLYFDGVEPGRRREGPVEVIFTPAEVEADDAILSDLAEVPPTRPVVVASSDRRVREGAAGQGAEVVSSQNLLRALRLRRS